MENEESIDEESGEQDENRYDHLRPWQYKKGQSGNPSGRPPGISLKEYARIKFRTMTDEEREEFFNGMDKKTLWEMAEGKPETKTDITTNGKELPQPILSLNAIRGNNSNTEDTGTTEED